jgi:hypothetical protein
MRDREKEGKRPSEWEGKVEEESPGRWQVRWGGVIGICPVDGRAGMRSKCFALRGVSRSQPSEDKQHP